MTEPSRWVETTRRNPNHSSWYIERFRSMADAGADLAGEARFVDAMAPRTARILDAGCGPGRVGAELAGLVGLRRNLFPEAPAFVPETVR